MESREAHFHVSPSSGTPGFRGAQPGAAAPGLVSVAVGPQAGVWGLGAFGPRCCVSRQRFVNPGPCAARTIRLFSGYPWPSYGCALNN